MSNDNPDIRQSTIDTKAWLACQLALQFSVVEVTLTQTEQTKSLTNLFPKQSVDNDQIYLITVLFSVENINEHATVRV